MLVKALQRLEAHQELVLDVVRVYLGAGLLFRGFALIGLDTGFLKLAGGVVPGVSTSALFLYVAGAHLVGGALMLVGLYTRFAALIQLPVLIGAVFVVHGGDELLSANQSLEFSALVLFLLLIVCVFGGGRWSLDAKWRRERSLA